MKQNADKKTRLVVYTLFILLLGVFLAYGFIYKFPAIFQETITKIEKDVTVTDEGIADAVEKVYDSVIIVSTYKGDTLKATGSGFVYKKDNDKFYVITNHHVIESGDNFKITYTDSTVEDVKLIGSDEYADIAVLEAKVKEGVKAVSIGKTDTLRVGDTAFTVGAPLDNVYSWTVTRGIISGKKRLVEVSNFIMSVLQTDAAVNSGNSGGPLCNSNGDVIGVISAKISSTGVEGMGFAIPIETAEEKAEQIIKGEISEYPYLGVSMYGVEKALNDLRYSNYLIQNKITKGALIVGVEKNSAASKAGLQVNDVILEINDVKISNDAYLRYELYKYKVGDTVSIKINRNGKEMKISVKLTSSLPQV